ncbi:MAG: glycosyltransferase family 39 protein [Candidatus Omnitrophica bacterium]|nr:glycosyltransferase family 39 protein [Candidatus Omnitrophota bacterium]
MKKIKQFFPLFLIVVTLLLTVHGMNQGGFRCSDESRHAMDGVFIMDILKDAPHITDLYRYTEIYFAKYPALAITWYPPFFAFVESIFFNIFGISEVIARLTVIFFALIAVIFLYLFLKKAFNEVVALLSCLLFITTPVVVFWARSVMLELPIMALVILSCYFFYNYFFLSKSKHIYYLTIAITLALYTKQTAAFLFPLFFSWILFQKQYKKLLKGTSKNSTKANKKQVDIVYNL